eukprot:CAMPEP_0115164006 /NCGR_PEP_ID=MMETSP0227-20121206/72806_1 /TAXON_ID=89957 /ORGANISM="Polarella glacialis, Strain CCMP 1383" /LENGTH=100 /DNA_ID=CAMNT_0002576337 /DNA_START=646 /DNA_END=949 /DNA_ORIENTATION=-
MAEGQQGSDVVEALKDRSAPANICKVADEKVYSVLQANPFGQGRRFLSQVGLELDASHRAPRLMRDIASWASDAEPTSRTVTPGSRPRTWMSSSQASVPR